METNTNMADVDGNKITEELLYNKKHPQDPMYI